MFNLQDCRVLITGGAGSCRFAYCRLAGERINTKEIVILITLFAADGRISNGRWRMVRSRSLKGICDRAALAETMRGIDIVFHQAAIRITQCAEEPRLAVEVLVDGTVERVGRSGARWRQESYCRLFRFGLRHGGRVPDDRATPSLQ